MEHSQSRGIRILCRRFVRFVRMMRRGTSLCSGIGIVAVGVSGAGNRGCFFFPKAFFRGIGGFEECVAGFSV